MDAFVKKRSRLFISILTLASAATLLSFLFAIDEEGFSFLKDSIQALQGYVSSHFVFSVFLYILSYALLKMICVPGMFLLTVLGGAAFGYLGLPLTMLASTTGSVTTFLLARYFFQEVIRRRWGDQVSDFNKQIGERHFLFVVSMRLIPVIPYYLVNLVLPLTKVETRSFIIGTLVGMIPIHTLYTFAGTEITKLDSHENLIGPSYFAILLFLGVFPFIVKFVHGRLVRK